MLERKLALATKRREGLRAEKESCKTKKNLDFFNKCLILGERNFAKNIKTFKLYECERQKNMEVTLHRLHRILSNDYSN